MIVLSNALTAALTTALMLDPREVALASAGPAPNGPGDGREPACDPNEQRPWRALVSTYSRTGFEVTGMPLN